MVAKCHICLENMTNTGKARLEKHRIRCEMLHHSMARIKVKARKEEVYSEMSWIEPGDRFEALEGFWQSEEPDETGTYYVKCKGCSAVLEDSLGEELHEHREACTGGHNKVSGELNNFLFHENKKKLCFCKTVTAIDLVNFVFNKICDICNFLTLSTGLHNRLHGRGIRGRGQCPGDSRCDR